MSKGLVLEAGCVGMMFMLFFGSCNLQKRIPQSPNFVLTKIDRHCYVALHKVGGKAICNVGVVDLGDKTLLFDSFLSPLVAAELVAVLKRMGLPAVGYVVNSHSHNDHIRGNQVFGDEVEIISSVKTAELIQSTEPTNIVTERRTAPLQLNYYDSLAQNFSGDTNTVSYLDINMWRPYYQVLVDENASIAPTLPNRTIDKVTTISGRTLDVVLIPTSTGHSQGDLYLHIPSLDVVFAGDLMFKQIHPFLGAGDLEAWSTTLNDIKLLNPKMILPGHGPLAVKDDVDILLAYMKDIQLIIAEGQSPEVLTVPDQYRDWLLADFFRLNIQLLSSRN